MIFIRKIIGPKVESESCAVNHSQRSSSWLSTLNLSLLTDLKWRLLPIQLGIVATFAMIPLWARFHGAPLPWTANYVTGFVILVPILWTIGWWLALGLPGFAAFRRDLRRAVWALALLALVVWAYASSSWALVRDSHPGVAINGALQLGLVVLFVIALASARPPARVLVGVLVFDLIWNSLLADWQVAVQGSVGLSWLGEFTLSPTTPGISIVQAGNLRWMRPYALLPHPNTLGGLLAIGLLAGVTGLLAERRAIRWVSTAVFLLGLWSFLLTFSRAAWIGFAAGAFAVYPLLRPMLSGGKLLKNPLFRQVLLTFALVILAGVAFVILYRPLLSARAGIDEESVELRSISDRVVFADIAYSTVAQHPLLGVGISNFPWRAADYLSHTNYDLKGDNVHQVLLSVLAELGIVGYVLVVIALIAGTEAVLRGLRAASGRERTSRALLFAGFMVLTIVGLFDHYPSTLIQFQVAWWGLLAAAMTSGEPTSAPKTEHLS